MNKHRKEKTLIDLQLSNNLLDYGISLVVEFYWILFAWHVEKALHYPQ